MPRPNPPNRDEAILKRHTSQIVQLQEKSLKLQEMLLKVTGQSIAPSDSEFAEIAPIEVFDMPGATTTVLAFAGLATAFGMPPREFFRTLTNHGCTVVFVKDFRQCWYVRGLLGLSEDIDSTVAPLRRAIPERTRRLRVVGASAGAYAAIQFGIRLGAEKVLAFAPQTVLQPRVFAQFASPDSHKRDVNFESPDADLANLFDRFPDHGCRINIHYGGQNAVDRKHARHLEGRRGVSLTVHDDDQHAVAKFLQARGELDGILADFVA